MGPELHQIRHALKKPEKTTQVNVCTEDIVNRKLMEVKGRMLQMGSTRGTNLDLTFRRD